MLKEKLDGKKTYLAAIAAVLIAVGGAINDYCTGQRINLELVISSIIALALIFLRKGIKTEVEKIP